MRSTRPSKKMTASSGVLKRVRYFTSVTGDEAEQKTKGS